MRKHIARMALGLMTFALIVMTAHVFTHIAGSAEDLVQCPFCQALAGLSAPTAPAVEPEPGPVVQIPLPALLSFPFIVPAAAVARAPPAA